MERFGISFDKDFVTRTDPRIRLSSHGAVWVPEPVQGNLPNETKLKYA